MPERPDEGLDCLDGLEGLDGLECLNGLNGLDGLEWYILITNICLYPVSLARELSVLVLSLEEFGSP